jgi:hypothetical protein
LDDEGSRDSLKLAGGFNLARYGGVGRRPGHAFLLKDMFLLGAALGTAVHALGNNAVTVAGGE